MDAIKINISTGNWLILMSEELKFGGVLHLEKSQE